MQGELRLKYKDLEAIVASHLVRDQVHFTNRIEFARATHATTLARILVDIPEKDQASTGGYAIFGRISKPSGRVVSTFERAWGLGETTGNGRDNPNRAIAVALEPGTHQLALVVKDVCSENVGVEYTAFEVPGYKALKQR